MATFLKGRKKSKEEIPSIPETGVAQNGIPRPLTRRTTTHEGYPTPEPESKEDNNSTEYEVCGLVGTSFPARHLPFRLSGSPYCVSPTGHGPSKKIIFNKGFPYLFIVPKLPMQY